MNALRMFLGLTTVSTLSIAAAVHAARPCPPDIDCSGTVNVNDLLSVINAWGTSGSPSDVTGDGSVNVGDLLGVINAWGACQFTFAAQANAEAHQVGLEMLGSSGPLTLPQANYDRIVRDIGLIRAARPELAGQTHSAAWVPNQMLVSVPDPQAADYLCLNTYYGVTTVAPLFSTWYTLTFAGKVNVPALAEIYMASGAVSFAEPNGFVGGQNFWHPVDAGGGIWNWSIDDGWHDCFDGCDCHRQYSISIDAGGAVTVQSVNQFGQRWCDFSGGT